MSFPQATMRTLSINERTNNSLRQTMNDFPTIPDWIDDILEEDAEEYDDAASETYPTDSHIDYT